MGYLVSRYRKRLLRDVSERDLSEMTREVRYDVGKQLIQALFPEGLLPGISAQVERFRLTWQQNFERRLWKGKGNPPAALQECADYIAQGEGLAREVTALRSAFGQSVVAEGELAPAAARARLLFGEGTRYSAGEGERFWSDLSSVLSLEDAQVLVVDRGLLGAELARLSAVPAATVIRLLVYDIEQDTAARVGFLRSLEQLRGKRTGLVAVRAVKFAGQERTPLDRCVVLGSDWGIELSRSLSDSHGREQVVRLLDDAMRDKIKQQQVDPYWSIELLTTDPRLATVQAADL